MQTRKEIELWKTNKRTTLHAGNTHAIQITRLGVKATTLKAKAKDLASKAKAKAKDMTRCPRGHGLGDSISANNTMNCSF